MANVRNSVCTFVIDIQRRQLNLVNYSSAALLLLLAPSHTLRRKDSKRSDQKEAFFVPKFAAVRIWEKRLGEWEGVDGWGLLELTATREKSVFWAYSF